VSVADALGRWSEGRGPLHQQLSARLRLLVETGAIERGARLPTERVLAGQLAVSRTTVVAAYSALKKEGVLRSRQGSGTWVASGGEFGGGDGAGALDGLGGRVSAAADPGRVDDVLDLSLAASPAIPLVAETFRAFAGERLDDVLQRPGYEPRGLRELRAAVATRLGERGLPTGPGQILVTTGAQQALALVAALLVRRGDPIVVENPTHAGALDVFRAAGGELIPVAVDDEGMRVDQVERVLRSAPARLVYVTPTYHNPTGCSLSPNRRERLAELARTYDTWIVEDDGVAEVPLTRVRNPPLATHLPAGPLLLLGSASKLFWGGLRVGWVRGSDDAIARLARLKTVADMGSPVLDQALAAELVARTEEAQEQRRSALAPRLAALRDELARQLPEWRCHDPAGGLWVWVHMPHGQAREFAAVALREGVAVLPGPVFDLEDGSDEYVRLAFNRPPDILRTAVARLAATERRFQP
jgi:DNA-binding transcriptional MocR family regulator